MPTDIILHDKSVEVQGKLVAVGDIELTKNTKFIGRFNKNSDIAFSLNTSGRFKLGSKQHAGVIHLQDTYDSTWLTASRCETKEVIGFERVSAGKPLSTQEGARRGINGQISIHGADSEDAQVEILGKSGDIRMSGSILPTADAPMLYIYEQGTSNPPRTIIAHSPKHKNWGLSYNDRSDNFIFQRAGTSVLNVNLGQKRVGIGTESPTEALHVNGKVAAAGFDNLSDSKCKDIKGEIDDALAKIQNLRGVRFRWNSDCASQNTDDREHLGVIAQEVEVVLPEVVSEREDGTKSVAYSELIPVLIQALKEEVSERSRLEERLQALESKVEQLLNTTTAT